MEPIYAVFVVGMPIHSLSPSAAAEVFFVTAIRVASSFFLSSSHRETLHAVFVSVQSLMLSRVLLLHRVGADQFFKPFGMRL